MAIKILPARLANQIAAGEVVERPASVVKELVENCIDSGATQIDIEIDKGGSKRILVRDNGSGIAKEELELALSRHATSKIHSLDDLEAIISLGFRGEALASISSVSRLTLTSRPAEQSEAWAAYAEGRDMTVTIKPAAHPTGTSVEVVDLFFNTPARRKFLRTDKTEFGHIDELIKRIALSRFDIGITLSHNGTLIRQYRKVTTEAMRLRRLEAICGRQFVKHAVAVEVEHCGLGLKGWVCHPHGARAQSDVQHCFVNQRMMKDKLINHAIRQGYANALRADQFAAYVLFIDIDADQVDVNVHPAKHEVRFHQARWVHDFIYQSVADVLRQCLDSSGQTFLPTKPDVLAPVSEVSNASLAPSVSSVDVASYGGTTQSLDSTWQRASRGRASPSAKAQLNYGNLLAPTPERQLGEISRQYDSAEIEVIRSESLSTQFLGQPLSIVGSTYLLMQQKTELVLMDLNYAAYLLLVGQFQCGEKRTSLQAYPLLIPVVLNLTTSEIKIALEVQSQLAQFGIQFKKKSDTQLMLLTVCAPMKQVNLQQIFPRLLAQSATLFKSHTPASAALGQVLARLIFQPQSSFMLTKAITLIADLENCWQGKLSAHFSRLLRPVDLSGVIEAFSYE